jgi:hypothetical protein
VKSDEFQLKWAWTVAAKSTGLLVPIFAKGRNNSRYVPEVEQDGKISRFVLLCHELEGSLWDIGGQPPVKVGDKVPFVWLDADQVVVRHYEDAEQLTLSGRFEEPDGSLLAVQLTRLFSTNTAAFWNSASAFQKSRSASGFLEASWLGGEVHVFQRIDSFWAAIQGDPGAAAASGDDLAPDYPLSDGEELFHWLSRNQRARTWTRAWLHAKRISAADARLDEIGADWLSRRLEDPTYWNKWTGRMLMALLDSKWFDEQLHESVAEALSDTALFVPELELTHEALGEIMFSFLRNWSLEDAVDYCVGCLTNSYQDVRERCESVVVSVLAELLKDGAPHLSGSAKGRLSKELRLDDIRHFLRAGRPEEAPYLVICAAVFS